jgi:hypothetical protein
MLYDYCWCKGLFYLYCFLFFLYHLPFIIKDRLGFLFVFLELTEQIKWNELELILTGGNDHTVII